MKQRPDIFLFEIVQKPLAIDPWRKQNVVHVAAVLAILRHRRAPQNAFCLEWLQKIVITLPTAKTLLSNLVRLL
jgi:hypothetical protein